MECTDLSTFRFYNASYKTALHLIALRFRWHCKATAEAEA